MLELMIAVVILGVLTSYGVPRFYRVMEQSRVDMACSNLESLWTAERLHMARDGSFAFEVSALGDFLDTSFLTSIQDPESSFTYSITSDAENSFLLNATRRIPNAWSGTIVLNSSGTFSGSVSNGSTVITPSLLK